MVCPRRYNVCSHIGANATCVHFFRKRKQIIFQFIAVFLSPSFSHPSIVGKKKFFFFFWSFVELKATACTRSWCKGELMTFRKRITRSYCINWVVTSRRCNLARTESVPTPPLLYRYKYVTARQRLWYLDAHTWAYSRRVRVSLQERAIASVQTNLGVDSFKNLVFFNFYEGLYVYRQVPFLKDFLLSRVFTREYMEVCVEPASRLFKNWSSCRKARSASVHPKSRFLNVFNKQ